MDSQLQRYARRLVEEQLGRSKLLLAQVVSDISTVKTEQDTKFSDDEKIHLIRYKIRYLEFIVPMCLRRYYLGLILIILHQD